MSNDSNIIHRFQLINEQIKLIYLRFLNLGIFSEKYETFLMLNRKSFFMLRNEEKSSFPLSLLIDLSNVESLIFAKFYVAKTMNAEIQHNCIPHEFVGTEVT